MGYDKVKETGKGRRKFKSGSVRDVVRGKGSYYLLSPLAIDRVAKHYENGADKYNPRNWEKGQELSVYVDSGIRHSFDYLGGMRDEDHASAVVWNWMGLIHTEEMINRGLLPADLNDLPNYTGIKFDMPKPKHL